MQGKREENPLAIKDIFTVCDDLGGFLNSRTGKPAISTGMQTLDNIIWGLHKSELLVVASRPSQGKTSLTVQLAWNIAKQGIRVAYISLEMSAHSVLERILCNEFQIDGWKLRTGMHEQLAAARVNLDKLRSRLMTTPLLIVDDRGFRVDELEDIIRIQKPEVIFIDHLQRVSMQGVRSRQEALADYVQACKRFCLNYNVAIVLASQINRQGSQADNAMDFMKGSGEIEEGADTLASLRWVGRDKFFESPNDPTVDAKEYVVSILKQRNGPIDAVTLDFNVAFYKFTDRFAGVYAQPSGRQF